ncbi:MAG TPA: molybdopterin converting factor subunit 1 [Methylophilaceae bacterium]|nr:molybdopterin converting factor subunit 1 [Methylophilaceae bacterium]
MNIKVLYFARIKESVNYSTEDILLPNSVKTIADLKGHLAQRGDVWTDLFSAQTIRAAINHELVDNTVIIADGDEVAFFPPVTGG